MYRVSLAVLLVLAGLVIAPQGVSFSRTARADEPGDPPPLGKVILDNSLTNEGVFRTGACPTGRDTGDFVADGFRQKVTGRCTNTATSASMRTMPPGLSLPDGEISIEAKVVDGIERASFGMSVRMQQNGDAYSLFYNPVDGRAELRRLTAGPSVVLAERSGLPTLETGAWTRLAMRLDGERIWVFIGDQVVMAASDAALASGGIGLGVSRSGNPDEDAPVSIVWRKMKLTALADGDVARVPTYTPPPVAAQSPPFVPAAGTPPKLGRTIHEAPLTALDIIQARPCPTGRGSGAVVGEGYMLKTRGRCTETATLAVVGPFLSGLTLPDGELHVEFKVTNGFERATVVLWSRLQNGTSGYAAGVIPSAGWAAIMRFKPGEAPRMLAQRSDLASILSRDDWNELSIRLDGQRQWLLLNGNPALSAEDDAYQTGMTAVAVERNGNLDDEDEVAVVFRNLRVSAIEGGPDDRVPTYEPATAPLGQTSVVGGLPSEWLGALGRIH